MLHSTSTVFQREISYFWLHCVYLPGWTQFQNYDSVYTIITQQYMKYLHQLDLLQVQESNSTWCEFVLLLLRVFNYIFLAFWWLWHTHCVTVSVCVNTNHLTSAGIRGSCPPCPGRGPPVVMTTGTHLYLSINDTTASFTHVKTLCRFAPRQASRQLTLLPVTLLWHRLGSCGSGFGVWSSQTGP